MSENDPPRQTTPHSGDTTGGSGEKILEVTGMEGTFSGQSDKAVTLALPNAAMPLLQPAPLKGASVESGVSELEGTRKDHHVQLLLLTKPPRTNP